MSEFHTGAEAGGRRHADIPELRQIAESILDRLDPAVRLLVAGMQAAGPGKCEQVWCPVCALAALVSGEQHPLLNMVAEHSVALLTLARSMLDNIDSVGKPRPDPPAEPAGDSTSAGSTEPPEPGHYQHITVVINDSAE